MGESPDNREFAGGAFAIEALRTPLNILHILRSIDPITGGVPVSRGEVSILDATG